MVSRVGLVGLGFFGKILLDVLRGTPGVDVVAVHDRFPGKAGEIELKGARFFGQLEDLFEQQAMDAVVIAEIPAYHRRATELAAERGIHVYCEKPMANTLADCDAMIEVCARNRVKLMIGFKHRFAKAMSHARAQLPRLGRPYWGMYTYPLWKVDDPGWKFDENGTKGIVVENMVHAFDIMRYFFGDFGSLYAEGDTFVYPDTKLPDSAVIVARFKNGAIAAIGGGCTSEQRVTREYLDMHFERGIVQVSGNLDEPYNLRILMRDEPLPEDHHFEGSNGIREEIRHFIECIQAGSDPSCTGSDGRKALEVALAVVDSARTHKPAVFG